MTQLAKAKLKALADLWVSLRGVATVAMALFLLESKFKSLVSSFPADRSSSSSSRAGGVFVPIQKLAKELKLEYVRLGGTLAFPSPGDADVPLEDEEKKEG